jgi:hypothetical protein
LRQPFGGQNRQNRSGLTAPIELSFDTTLQVDEPYQKMEQDVLPPLPDPNINLELQNPNIYYNTLCLIHVPLTDYINRITFNIHFPMIIVQSADCFNGHHQWSDPASQIKPFTCTYLFIAMLHKWG